MKILAVGIALFHAVGRMDGWTDMTRLTAFTTALQTCLKEAYARQQRYIRPQLHWSQNRHNTTVWTDPDKEVDTNHITVYVSGNAETNPTGMLSPNNGRLSGAKKKWVCFEPTVWPDTCCSVLMIRVLLQWTKRI